MSHPEFFEEQEMLLTSVWPAGVQRAAALCRGAGVPKTFFLLARRRRRRAKRKKRFVWGTLHPRFWELFQKFGMTHNLNPSIYKNHISSILGRLGLRDRTQAAIYARENGLLRSLCLKAQAFAVEQKRNNRHFYFVL